MAKHFFKHVDFDPNLLNFALGVDRGGKPAVAVVYGPSSATPAMVTAPAVTMWPRVNGDGNFGTMWGPTDPQKAKFTLDLNDAAINGAPNEEYMHFAAKMNAIDDKLLDFVTEHQLKILGRKNLSREEVQMLQIRTVRPKYDKITGALNGHAVQLSVAKWGWDGMGGKRERKITVCDHTGRAVPNGVVKPGDVVAATTFVNQIYTGVGGDKFGIHWAFQDISVVCQHAAMDEKTEVQAFMDADWAFSKPYVDQVSEIPVSSIDATAGQFAIAT